MQVSDVVEIMIESIAGGEFGDDIARVGTFEEMCVMTSNEGVQVNMMDGRKFQITIVEC